MDWSSFSFLHPLTTYLTTTMRRTSSSHSTHPSVFVPLPCVLNELDVSPYRWGKKETGGRGGKVDQEERGAFMIYPNVEKTGNDT